MLEPLNYRPSHNATYYTPPRELDTKRVVLAWVVTALIASLGGYIYAAIQPDLDNLYLRGGASVAAAFVVGVLAIGTVRFGKVRSPIVATTLGILLALLTLYVIWLKWVHDIFHNSRLVVPYLKLIAHPLAELRIIQAFNRSGTWSYHGMVANGFPLLVFWLCEAGMILAAGALMPLKALVTEDPICRECSSQCIRAKNFPRFTVDRQNEFLTAIEDRNFGLLASHAAPRSEDAPELRIKLMSCPKCGAMNVLTINRIAWYLDSKKTAKVKIAPLIDQQLITTEEAEQLKIACKLIQEHREAERAANQGDQTMK